MPKHPTAAPLRRQSTCLNCSQPFAREPRQRRRCCTDACASEWQKKREADYYASNADRRKAQAKARYAGRRDRQVAAQRERYQSDEQFREGCKRRSTESKRRRAESDPDGYRRAWRDKHLRKTYAIGVDEYDSILASQGGGCAICGAKDGIAGGSHSLCVDHDHRTGTIRGILCFACNRAIGAFKDDPGVVAKAASYLMGFTSGGGEQ